MGDSDLEQETFMRKFCIVPTSQYGPNCGNSWFHQHRMASLRKILQPC